MPLGVLLADEHPITRAGLKNLLHGAGFAVLAECSDGEQAVRLAETIRPDLAILELTMPRLNGIEAARGIQQVSPRSAVVLMTALRKDEQVLEAVRAGVKGYILKTEAVDAVVQAVREVSRGNLYLSPGVSRVVVNACRSGAISMADPLSQRELQILKMIAEGHTAREIATHTSLSAKTVESYRKNLMDKLSIRETANLVRYAIRRGLINP